MRWFDVCSGARSGALVVAISLLGGCDRDPLVHQDDPGARKLYEKKVKAWMRWALEQPWSVGPILDTDGSACGSEQHGGTWFLAGTEGGDATRECTIPAGKALFFPLVNYWYQPPAEIWEMYPEQEWIDGAAAYFAERRAATCGLTLRIEGEDLLPDLETMDEELYVEIVDPFTVELGDDSWASVFGDAAGPRETMVQGHWALIEPLPPGDYTLELGGELCGEDFAFSTSVTYSLHIEG